MLITSNHLINIRLKFLWYSRFLRFLLVGSTWSHHIPWLSHGHVVAFRGNVGGLGAGQGLCDRGQAPQGPSCAAYDGFSRKQDFPHDLPRFFGMFQGFLGFQVFLGSSKMLRDFPRFYPRDLQGFRRFSWFDLWLSGFSWLHWGWGDRDVL